MFLHKCFLNISATIDHLQGIHVFAFEFAKVVKRDSFCSCKFYVFTSLLCIALLVLRNILILCFKYLWYVHWHVMNVWTLWHSGQH